MAIITKFEIVDNGRGHRPGAGTPVIVTTNPPIIAPDQKRTPDVNDEEEQKKKLR